MDGTERRARYDVERLLFRRQFILGPRFLEQFPSWKRINVGQQMCLTVHPDLAARQVSSHNKAITLLGYILDPNDPGATDADILNRLLRDLCACDSLNDFFKCTYELGGRWILIVNNNGEIRLFHDAAGYRQVFFTDSFFCKEIWCASEPGRLAQILRLKVDQEAEEFIRIYESIDKEYWWPGDSTLYREARCLLPNHYLDLRTGSHHRYWPDSRLQPLSLDEGVKECAGLLQGLLKSAASRFHLAVALTAGRDSRSLLAACREVRHRVSFWTFLYWNLNEDSPDVAVPARLLPKLGLKHHTLQCLPSMDPDFERLYMRNVAMAHKAWGTIAQGLYHSFPQGAVYVKGNAVPIAKCNYYYKLTQSERAKPVTAYTLAKLHKIEGNMFARRAFDEWLTTVGETFNIELLDLFDWEQKEGRWQAMSQTEWDIVHEVFEPYNCRALLSSMLSIPKEYRKPPDYEMHRAITANLWPEVLCEPINPHLQKRQERGKQFSIRRALRKVLVAQSAKTSG